MMFINFSNHPSQQWSKRQTDAARCYGEIVDLPFPVIDPAIDHEELSSLANKYVKKILLMASGHHVTIHVMGEMTFTFMIVTMLKSVGIECVASTTERNVEETLDGRKTVVFQFVRFRRY